MNTFTCTETKSYKHIPIDNNFSFCRELPAMEKVKRKKKKITSVCELTVF